MFFAYVHTTQGCSLLGKRQIQTCSANCSAQHSLEAPFCSPLSTISSFSAKFSCVILDPTRFLAKITWPAKSLHLSFFNRTKHEKQQTELYLNIWTKIRDFHGSFSRLDKIRKGDRSATVTSLIKSDHKRDNLSCLCGISKCSVVVWR